MRIRQAFIPLLFLFCFTVTLDSKAGSPSLIDLGWQQISQNQFSDAEASFLKAAKKEDPVRAYLALSFINQLLNKEEAAWDNYEKVLSATQMPFPYIFASVLTSRSLLQDPEEQKGMMKIFPTLTERADSDGLLRVGSLEYLGRIYQGWAQFDKANEYFKQMGAIESWTLIGPFENISASGHDKVFPPELEYNMEIEYPGKNAVPAKWFKVGQIRPDRWVDFTRYFATTEAVFYGNTFIYSPEKQMAQIRVGTSGSVRVFLNDAPIIDCADENNNDLDTYIAETELDAGWNRLLVKCGYSEISQCNFLVRVTSSNGEKLPGLQYDTNAQQYPHRQQLEVKRIPNFAETYFTRQIEQYPDRMENYLLLAECYLRNDKAIEAEKILRLAESKMPQSVLIKKHLLEAYIRGEKQDEINTIIAKINTLYPDIPDVLETLYNEYVNNENLEQAEAIANRYWELKPESINALLMRMNTALFKGEMETAMELLQKSMELYPSKWDAVYIAALLSIRTTNGYDGAAQIYSDYLKHHYNENAYIELGNCYLNSGNIEMFEKTFLDLIAIDPAASGIYFYLARVFNQVQDYEKAESYINQAIELCPSKSEFWSLLGEIFQGKGDRKKAIANYKEAIRYNSKDYTARDRLRELEDKDPVFNRFTTIPYEELIGNAPDASQYPDDNAVFLLDDVKRVMYHNGASEVRNEILIKVFNAEGINAFNEYWIPQNRYSEKLIVEKAIAIKADGSEVKADLNNNQVVFKSLEPGDFIYIKWRIQTFNSGRLSSHLWEDILFTYFYPVENIRYSLLIPEDMTFNHKTQNMPDEPNVKKTPDGLLYEWALHDQPAVDSEYNMPPLSDVAKMLYISTIPDWEYIVDWFLDLAKTKTNNSYEIREKVAELLPDAAGLDEIEKIRCIYNFITENIRYSSQSFRQSAHIPQKARNVLVQKIGDCKDMATLAIAMLKEAGVSSHYVLVNTFDEGQNQNTLPSIGFNHVIVGAETEPGILYMDLTAQNYPLFSLPENDKDAFALSIRPGVQAPFILDQSLFKTGSTKRTAQVAFLDDNSAVIDRETIKSGLPAARFRDGYRFKGKNDQITELTESLVDDFPNPKVTDFEIDAIDSIGYCIKYRYQFTVPFFLLEASDMKLLKLPWSDCLYARRALSYDVRHYDYQYRADSDTLWEAIEVVLPPGYVPFDKGETVRLDCSIASYILTIRYEANLLKATRLFVNKQGIVRPEAYQEFKDFYNQAMRMDTKQILLKKE